MIQHNIKQEISNTLATIPLCDRIKTLVIALSGGPDSLALLLALNDLKDDLGLKLHIAHMNHGLRGKESDGDEEFVIDLAKRLKLPYTTTFEDVGKYSKTNKISIEEASRNLRYQFLAKVTNQENGLGVALGHTRDDQIETILMHLIRGSGLNGMLGMSIFSYWPSQNDLHRVMLIRPLLNINKDSTKKYCFFKNLNPRIDTSNSSLDFTRNRIRAELIPLIESYNQNFGTALLKTSTIAKYYQEYVEKVALDTMEFLSIPTENGVTFTRDAFCEQHRAIQGNLILSAYEKIVGNTKKIKSAHIDTIVKLANNGKNKIVHLPNDLMVWVDAKNIWFGSKPFFNTTKNKITKSHIIKVPGKTTIPGWEIISTVTSTFSKNSSDNYQLHLEAAQINEPMFIRGRQPGDRFIPSGMNHSKKLQDFMVDIKLPTTQRDSVPIVILGNKIIWVVGYRKAEGLGITLRSKKIIRIKFKPTELY